MRTPLLLLTLALLVPAGATSPLPDEEEAEVSLDDLQATGERLFEELAPKEVKEQFRFPTMEEWDGLVARLQTALQDNDLAALAAYEPEARTALAAWRMLPGYEPYVTWLQERVDYIQAAHQAARNPPPPADSPVPHYELWLKRLQARPVPARAGELLPRLGEIFAAAGLPAELAWLAEVESTFDPEALSPVGARGLFQLMPGTARELGLNVLRPDERSDPDKNAHAAARYLRQLHDRFGDWPLALAAYNAGPGRVRRTLAWRRGKTFADIAPVLPAETAMYVPKVLATLAVRTGLPPDGLPAPRP